MTEVITTIELELTQTFDELFKWFRAGSNLLHYAPGNNRWSIRKILEHISLTNHFLLKSIRKGTVKAIERSKKAAPAGLNEYDLDCDRMKVIGQHQSFEWNRPGHMEPRGKRPLTEVEFHLQLQLKECLELLAQLQHGEGTLYKTMMSVNNLGKIDVYHYLYFLVQHAKKHIAQMEKVEIEFNLGI